MENEFDNQGSPRRMKCVFEKENVRMGEFGCERVSPLCENGTTTMTKPPPRILFDSSVSPCICVFVYLCICVFVYLYICVFVNLYFCIFAFCVFIISV